MSYSYDAAKLKNIKNYVPINLVHFYAGPVTILQVKHACVFFACTRCVHLSCCWFVPYMVTKNKDESKDENKDENQDENKDENKVDASSYCSIQ